MELSLDIASLRQAYADGITTPQEVMAAVMARARADTQGVWISLLSDEQVNTYVEALCGKDAAHLPLYGIPFAIKDNIDLAGVETTAACREFAYVAQKNAFVVQCLIDAGAIPVGKTNLDQFATGLNGTRSPWGACHNAFNDKYISGGSSSGSAVAVAKGYASFALGTDTAGSGRVPAAFNNLIGHKPSLGWLSASGMVPACRSLDTISIFALTAEDAESILSVAAQFDATDAYARRVSGHGFDFGRAEKFRFGVARAEQLAFFGDAEAERLYHAAVARLVALGGERVEIDLQPFLDTARLLYDGPWVAERYAALRDFIEAQPDAPLPVIQTIVGGAKKWLAADAYAAAYRLKAAKRECDAVWQDVDVIVTPTAGTIYSVDEMLADPIQLNSNLGYYTNFMNLLDYAATAVPAGLRSDDTPSKGLPFGVTLFAAAAQDGPLLRLAARMQRKLFESKETGASLGLGATSHPLPMTKALSTFPSGMLYLAVCGAHMSGFPLNHELTSRGARLVGSVKSAPDYRFYLLPGGLPLRPGMVRVDRDGAAIDMEVWQMPQAEFGSFIAGVPAPLGIGRVKLADGSSVLGFVCEAVAVTAEARDITTYGGWKKFMV